MVTTAPTTFRDDEVVLGGYRLPVKGPVRVQYVPQYPGKVTIGATTRADQTVADEFVQDDWREGLLIRNLDTAASTGRFWWSTVDTRTRRKMHLLPLVFDIPKPDGVTKDCEWLVEYGDRIHACFDGDWYSWDDANSAWSEVLFTTSTGTTDAIVYRGSLYVAYGSGYSVWDGNSSADYTEDVTYFATFDVQPMTKLIKSDSSGVIKASADGITWVSEVGGIIYDATITDLVPFRNNVDEPELFVATDRGLIGLNVWDNTNSMTSLQILRNKNGGMNSLVWNDGNLYYPDGLAVWRYPRAGQINDVGLDRDDGLPTFIRGRITQQANTPNYLIVGINATTVLSDNPNTDDVHPAPHWGSEVFLSDIYGGQSALFAFNGTGWHTLYVSDEQGAAIVGLMLSTVYADERRLWFSKGGSIHYIVLPEGNYDPTLDGLARFNQEGEFQSAWFDSGTSETPKLATSLKLRVAPGTVTSTETIDVFYGLDGAEGWTYLGTADDTTVDSSGVIRFPIAQPDGLKFYSIRFKLYLRRGTDSSKTPVLLFYDLRYKRTPPMLWGWTFTVYSEEYRFLQELWQTVRALCAAGKTYQFGFRAAGEEEKLVMITSVNGIRNPGKDTTSTFTFTVVELDE